MKCLILCGGNGTRLWPASTKNKPKQFIPLLPYGDKLLTLLELTIERVKDFGEVVLLGNEKYIDLMPKEYRTVLEPSGRDTAAACITAAILYPDDDILILPADHHIPDKNKFQSFIKSGNEIIKTGHICTFGIEPTYPETGFGYIKLSEHE